MFHDSKSMSMSPSKGKTKEKTHWQMGWWDFYPLVERSLRPVEWSRSSVIFTAHPTQPLLTAHHFSSSKQFVIPCPAPVTSSPASYDPPSVISAAPGDDWLFAYFPMRDGDGTACLWKRGPQIDNWDVKEWWSFAHGAGVVSASWLGTTREWATDALGHSARLPPRGPRTPVSSPTLLLVTQDHQVKVCYFRHYIPSLKIISCSIGQPSITPEQPHLAEDQGLNSSKQCFKAAIGLGYNESSILIATRSLILPPPSADNQQFNSMDLTLPVESNPQSLETRAKEWEAWGEESTIHLCEIQIKFDGFHLSLTAHPLPPILHPGTGLVNLVFICPPPWPAISPDARRQPSSRKNNSEKGQFYLAATYLDFGDYTSTPKSELVLHSILRQMATPSSNSIKNTWISRNVATRLFTPGVLAFISFPATPAESTDVVIYAGILDTSGSLTRPTSKVKETSIGTVKALNISDLSDNEGWDTSLIMSPMDKVGRDLPLNFATSPNSTLLCSISSPAGPMQASIHLLPRWRNGMQRSELPIHPLASSLASATLSRKTSADITHILSLPSTHVSVVTDILYQVLNILDGHQNGLSHSLTYEVLGLALDIYRTRALRPSEEGDRDNLTARWKAAHDLCTLAACSTAFEDCNDGETYDLEAVWQLIGLSSWVIGFTERVMKECVMSCDLNKREEETAESSDDLFGSGPSSPAFSTPLSSIDDSPILLHLVHPLALQKFSTALAQVKRFRAYIGSLSVRGENAHIARDVLIDLVDNSGVDFTALETLLAAFIPDSQALDGDDCRRALASCQPTPAMHIQLDKVMQKLTKSTTLNKSMLFIKPFDLVDGVARLSVGHAKDKDKDVISKRILMQHVPSLTCLRCGGISEMGRDMGIGEHISIRWRAWEKTWTLRCICGGPWIRNQN